MNMNGNFLYLASQFHGNNDAVLRPQSQCKHHQLESCCSTAWPSWYRENVFMQSPGTKVTHTSKSLLHTQRAYWDKQSQFIYKMVLGGM